MVVSLVMVVVMATMVMAKIAAPMHMMALLQVPTVATMVIVSVAMMTLRWIRW